MQTSHVGEVEFSKLFIDPTNVRAEHSAEGVKELADNIRSKLDRGGIHQSLLVRQSGKRYGIIAGGRRYTALSVLKEEGAIKGTYKVPVRFFEGTDEEAVEASLAENQHRQGMTDADFYVAFRDMHQGGKGLSVEDIASRYGCGVRRVRALIALGSVPETALEALRTNKLSVKQLEDLASCPYPERVEEALGKLDEFRYPQDLRRFLMTDETHANHKLMKYVGLAAYKKAGGTLREDLFASDESKIVEDFPLLVRLATEKLQRKADGLTKDCWATVQPADVDENFYAYSLNLAEPRVAKMKKKDQTAHEKLVAERDALNEEWRACDDWGERYNIDQKRDKVQKAIKAAEKPYEYYDDEQKAICTVHIWVTHDGKADMAIEAPVVEEEAAPKERPAYTKPTQNNLIETKTYAAAQAMTGNLRVAKIVMIVPFIQDRLRVGYHGRSVKLKNENALKRRGDNETPVSTAAAFLETLDAFMADNEFVDGIGKEESAQVVITNRLLAMTDEELDKAFMLVAAAQLNFNSYSKAQPELAYDANLICNALGLDMTAHYSADEATLKGMRKEAIIEAAEEVGGADAVASVKTKKDAIAAVLPVLQEAQWLPPLLRT